MSTITEAYSGTATISTTEYSLTSNSTTLGAIDADGVYEIDIDFSALTVTEVYEFKAYNKVSTGSTQRLFYKSTIAGAQSSPNWSFPAKMLKLGLEFSLKKISGTDRSITWSIKRV